MYLMTLSIELKDFTLTFLFHKLEIFSQKFILFI